MKQIIDVLQLMGGILLSVGYIPQIIKLLKNKSVKDFSMFYLVLLAGGIALMEVYAAYNIRVAGMFFITNTLSLGLSVTVLTLYFVFRGKAKSKKVKQEQFLDCDAGFIQVDGRSIALNSLKSKGELIAYLTENGPTHASLMDFCEEYRECYQNELCWAYPISDGWHLGTFIVLIKEGVVSLPYDNAEKEDGEVFCLDDVCFFQAEDMETFIEEWRIFSSYLEQTMLGFKSYLLKEKDNDKN